jgi:hypothetical protein
LTASAHDRSGDVAIGDSLAASPLLHFPPQGITVNALAPLTPQQFGLSFEPPALLFDHAGTWSAQRSTVRELKVYLKTASDSIRTVPSFLQPALRWTLDRTSQSLVDQAPEASMTLRLLRLPDDADLRERFALWCLNHSPPALDVRIRATATFSSWAAHFEAIGTLVLHSGAHQRPRLSYIPYRSNEVRHTYFDRARHFPLPYDAFFAGYSADRIAQRPRARPIVSSFAHEGLRYVVTQIHSSLTCSGAEAWALMPLAEWEGDTLDYDTILAAWSDGRREVGNSRGLLVSAQGQPSVLHHCAYFYEEHDPDEHENRQVDDDDTVPP